MITQFSIQNFKSIKNKVTIDLKPITILCGANSSGKSALIKALMLLKQTLDSRDTANAVSLDGPYQVAKQSRDLLYLGGQNGPTIQYEFHICNEKRRKTGTVQFQIQTFAKAHHGKDNEISSFRVEDSNGNYLQFSKKAVSNGVESNISFVKSIFDLPGRDNLKWNQYAVGFRKFVPSFLERRKGGAFDRRIPFFVLDYESSNKPNPEINRTLSNFEESLQSISYLGPLRAYPQIAYLHFSKPDLTLDGSGANAAQVFWRNENTPVLFNGKKSKLKVALRKAFNMLGMKDSISVNYSGILYSLKVSISRKAKVPITEVGFGLSQSLPVLLTGLLAEKGSLVVFEQPEIHLHPEWKSNLADVFLALAKDDRQLLIETHSTELIDKLRLRIIEDPSLNNLVNIVFVEQDDVETSGTTVRSISIDSMGYPSEWPKGFCDQTNSLAQKIISARAGKMKGECK